MDSSFLTIFYSRNLSWFSLDRLMILDNPSWSSAAHASAAQAYEIFYLYNSLKLQVDGKL